MYVCMHVCVYVYIYVFMHLCLRDILRVVLHFVHCLVVLFLSRNLLVTFRLRRIFFKLFFWFLTFLLNQAIEFLNIQLIYIKQCYNYVRKHLCAGITSCNIVIHRIDCGFLLDCMDVYTYVWQRFSALLSVYGYAIRFLSRYLQHL